MRGSEWRDVKTGDLVIYADVHEGVFRAKVVTVDIAVFEPGSKTIRAHPWGLTADSGAVEIEYEKETAGNLVKQRKFENLGNLVKYTVYRLRDLRRKWSSYSKAKTAAEAAEEIFNAKVRELRSL
jgi:hypothetical protein